MATSWTAAHSLNVSFHPRTFSRAARAAVIEDAAATVAI